jgi:DNA-binding MarR family transcriptional regulator
MDDDDLRRALGRVARDCTASNLRRATRAVASIYDAQMAPTGLRSTQFNLLTAAALAGEAPVTRLAEILGLDRTTLTRNLAPLERDGLLESRPTADRRVRQVRLTAAGRKALVRALPRWEAAQRRVVAALGEPGWRQLIDHLRTASAITEERS